MSVCVSEGGVCERDDSNLGLVCVQVNVLRLDSGSERFTDTSGYFLSFFLGWRISNLITGLWVVRTQYYGVATRSRLLKIIGLCCKRAL